jgi:GNAT superfamily N-acetyltransferase
VNAHSVFLRKWCILPDRLDPLRKPVGENWTLVEEITAPVLDAMIRRTGWHFLCVLRPYSRRGFGLTEADAVQRALASALERMARRFNAAELIAVQATRYPGFYVASVILQPRQIQQFTSLEIAADWHRMIVPTR